MNRPRPPGFVFAAAVLALLTGSAAALSRNAYDTQQATAGAPTFLDVDPGGPVAVPGDQPGSSTTAPGPLTRGQDDGRPTAPSEDAPLTASDVGVTPDAIHLGAVLLKCAQCASFGADASANMPAITRTLIDDINARGGINGRRVQLEVSEFDSIADQLSGGDSERQACLDITERSRSFAVLSIGGSTPACIYDEHETPTFAPYPTSEADPDEFNRSQGRLWIVNPTARRTLTNWAQRLVDDGMLVRGEPFGILTSAALDYDDPVRNILIPALRAKGFEPAHLSVLPADFASQPSAAAVEGAAMRSVGVTKVLLAGDVGAALVFVQDAQRNRWSPQWLQTDYGMSANEVGAQVMPASFIGAVAVSVEGPIGDPVQPSTAYTRCHQLWEERVGHRTEAADELFLTYLCDLVTMFELGARNAGPNLTRQTLAQGLARIGGFELASLSGGQGSLGGAYAFGSTKWSAALATVTKRWDGVRYQVLSGPTHMGA